MCIYFCHHFFHVFFFLFYLKMFNTIFETLFFSHKYVVWSIFPQNTFDLDSRLTEICIYEGYTRCRILALFFCVNIQLRVYTLFTNLGLSATIWAFCLTKKLDYSNEKKTRCLSLFSFILLIKFINNDYRLLCRRTVKLALL